MKRILVAPINWGLGHATRCIPIIKALMVHNFEPIIASDGIALELLKKEFPKLLALELPSYNITYPKKGKSLKLKLLKDTPHLLTTIKNEKKATEDLIKHQNIAGIISDNRFGVRHQGIPSVFITHQLRVLSGSTTWLSSRIHQNIIRKFDECWIPDHSGKYNLSGELGHVKDSNATIKYIGPLSRFTKQTTPQKYDLMVLLSGPEPQRTYLEQKLLKTLQIFKGNVLFVKGKIEPVQQQETIGNMTIYNYMISGELETALNQSALVLCRSGYTSIMDLAKLEKKAFFIPTPGQYEQDYLAKRLTEAKISPSCNQANFTIEKLRDIKNYSGFESLKSETNYEKLFNLF